MAERWAQVESALSMVLLLAVSGLERIGRADVISEILSVETMMPPIGAGVLALQFGFRATLLVALGLYALAGLVFRSMRATALPGLHEPAPVPAERRDATSMTA